MSIYPIAINIDINSIIKKMCFFVKSARSHCTMYIAYILVCISITGRCSVNNKVYAGGHFYYISLIKQDKINLILIIEY